MKGDLAHHADRFDLRRRLVRASEPSREFAMVLNVMLIIVVLIALYMVSAVKVISQYERGVVLRFGRVQEQPRSPGITMIVPLVDRLHKVNLQIVTMPVPAQEGITRDNITVRVDAVLYFQVVDPIRAVINVEDYLYAMGQVAQSSLRSIIGKSDLDDLLSNREKLNQGLELMIDNPAVGWGVHIDRVEIKDVSLPESMKRSIARQAEAERERRSRIISADGEYQASQKLSEAAHVMSDTPAALQLRLLETVVEVAAERNSTLVLPFPVELLRFVEHVHGRATSDGEGQRGDQRGAEPEAAAAASQQATDQPLSSEDVTAPTPRSPRFLDVPATDAGPQLEDGKESQDVRMSTYGIA